MILMNTYNIHVLLTTYSLTQAAQNYCSRTLLCAVFSTQLNQLTSVNTELQTKSNNQVLGRALLMKQNLIFGLVWAGWRV